VKTSTRIHLPQIVIVKAAGLLPMLYTPKEICDELGIAESTLRDWIRKGIPHQRDNRHRIWINGEAFAHWVTEQRKHKHHHKLQKDEAYCFHCKQITKLISPEIQPRKGKLVLIKGSCSICGNTIYRGANDDRKAELSQN